MRNKSKVIPNKKFDYKKLAKDIFNDIQKLQVKNTPNLRRIRKKYSKKLDNTAPEHILDLARYFMNNYNYRWCFLANYGETGRSGKAKNHDLSPYFAEHPCCYPLDSAYRFHSACIEQLS